MILVVSTGDRESDLLLTRNLVTNTKEFNNPITFDCESIEDCNKFDAAIDAIPLFSTSNSYIVHNVKFSSELEEKIINSENNILLVTLIGKWVKIKTKAKVLSQPISDVQIKNNISNALADNNIPTTKDTLAKIYTSLSFKNYMGKDKLSPLQADIFVRRINALGKDLSTDQLNEILNLTEDSVNQWLAIDNLFSNNKKEQIQYFSKLSKTVSSFELIATIKTTLFLLLAIITGLNENLSSSTIASKLQKNPFYITSLISTIKANSLVKTRVKHVLTRLMNLELMLKSGRFDDEQFGFDILLATS